MAKVSKGWGAIAEQNAKIASEGRQAGKAKASSIHEAEFSEPPKAGASEPPKAVKQKADEAVVSQPQAIAVEAVLTTPPPAKVEKRSTSLYLTPAAHKVIRIHAAKAGLKSNTVYENALRDYFAKHGLGDFDKENSTPS